MWLDDDDLDVGYTNLLKIMQARFQPRAVAAAAAAETAAGGCRHHHRPTSSSLSLSSSTTAGADDAHDLETYSRTDSMSSTDSARSSEDCRSSSSAGSSGAPSRQTSLQGGAEDAGSLPLGSLMRYPSDDATDDGGGGWKVLEVGARGSAQYRAIVVNQPSSTGVRSMRSSLRSRNNGAELRRPVPATFASGYHSDMDGADSTFPLPCCFPCLQMRRQVSPWHSVPLCTSGGFLHFVCETPRGEEVVCELAMDEVNNPLRVSRDGSGVCRYRDGAPWNVGFLPQTYGDPREPNKSFGGFQYTGRAVEVLEFGSRMRRTGEVYKVKPIAAFAVIEREQLVWKVVAIACDDPLESLLHGAQDLDRPGLVGEMREWLRTSTRAGDRLERPNYFGLNERVGGRSFAVSIVKQAHVMWQNLKLHGAPLVRASSYADFQQRIAAVKPGQLLRCSHSLPAPKPSRGRCQLITQAATDKDASLLLYPS
eukprot:SM000001S04607  [mRNA]  locus=s1:1230929:1232982:+ [translate_table: standard]